jgi:hypothetical protein
MWLVTFSLVGMTIARSSARQHSFPQDQAAGNLNAGVVHAGDGVATSVKIDPPNRQFPPPHGNFPIAGDGWSKGRSLLGSPDRQSRCTDVP